MDDPEVLIVGAGPTGLMAACWLLRCGVSVRILDKSAEQAHETRAFGLQARSLELLQKMGLVQKFLERGITAAGARFYVDGEQAAELNFDDIGRDDTPYSFLFLIPQYETENILSEDLRARGVTVEHGHEVVALEQDAGGVTVQAKGSAGATQTIRAAYVLGADGAHSIVRKTLGLKFEGAPYPQAFMLADCRVKWPLDHARLKMFLRHRSLGICLPLHGTELSRVIAIRPADAPMTEAQTEATGGAPLTLPEVEHAFREATGVEVTLEEPRWLSRYRVHHRGVDRYRVGRVFVAGDAAHIHSPAGGQGMNTGLQDAANLAWKIALVLRGAHRAEPLLDSYHAERWPVGQRVLDYTDRVFGFVSSQTGWVAALRNLIVPVLTRTMARSGTLRSRAFHFISQLGIRYEGGEFLHDELSPDAPSEWKEGLTPGHRAPNGLIARHLDVFDLLSGVGFDVLAFSRRALDDAEVQRLTEALAALPKPPALPLRTHVIAHSLLGRDPRLHRAEATGAFQAYGVTHTSPEGLFLIRPDGHIAFRSDRLETAPLVEFLRRWQ